jgi:DNA repair protein RadC
MTISAQPIILRPRERLESIGPERMNEEELIAIIISTGTKGKNAVEIGQEILDKHNKDLLATPIDDLCKIKGLGKIKALKLKAAFELGLRHTEKQESKCYITTTKDVAVMLHEYVSKKQEHLILITLNGRNEMINKRVITIGTLNRSLFHPREVFAESITDRAAKIIIAHNHPSGTLIPSKNDLIMTKQIKEGGRILGIDLVDSVIISNEGFISILDFELEEAN